MTTIPDWKLAIYGRAVTGSGQRRKPSMAQCEEIRARQHNRCLYCDLKIGTIVWRGEYNVKLRTNWDHFVPYSYGLTNAGSNWVLSCHICNGIKGCRMFDTVTEAQAYIKERWAKKGYQLPILVLADDSDDVETVVDPEPEPEGPEPSYAPVPLELAKAAKVVCRRLANEMRPVSMARVLNRGGNEAVLRAAFAALLDSGHVNRRPRPGRESLFDYWLVRPYEVPREAQQLPELTWERGGVGKVKSRKQRSRFPGRENGDPR